MAAGGELIIDNKLLKILDNVDKKLEKIAKTSGSAQANIFKMFDKAGSQGVDGLIRKLQQLEKYYSTIGQNDSRGMKRIANDARKTADEINKLIAAVQQRWTPNFKGAMNYSQNAKTLSQDREAINRLRQARETLSRTDSDYVKKLSQINGAIAVHSSRLRTATGASHEMRRAHSGLMDISGQLTRRLALIFSVSQVQQYIGKIVQVRKEFELQQKALGAILRDQDRANELWDKTIQLAVKSPFSVKELITYTKQLAAYRIETDKLHDTTRMLADVSAGLGVDMNRIILAFGQVRAAEFLRGTELRQFTEAGIPLLEELAIYFSELEGRAVSTADVFERISKRMVLFKDVEQVFRDMTSEGGVFYQMQEKQSETLYGQIRNLYDSIDLMMNDIGKDKNGAIQMFIRLAKSAADNWRLLEPIINSIGIAFATHFGAKTLVSVVKYLNRAVVAMRSFGTASAAATATNPWLALVTVVALVGTAIYEVITYTDKLTAALDEIDRDVSKELQQSIASYKELADAITDVTKTTQEQEEAKKRLQRQFKDMLPDYLLEVEKFEDLSDAYLKAEQSLRTYFNSKALEQKKDKIEQHFQEDIDTEIANITSATRKNIEELRGVESETKKKLKDWVGISVAQSVEAAKEGLIEVEASENDITERLAKAVGVDEQLLRKGYARGSLVSSTYLDETLSDMRKTLTKRNEMLEEIEGLPFETSAQRDAAKMKHAMEEEIKTIEWYYSKMANVLKKVADGTATLQEAEDDRAKLWQQALAQSPNFGQYAKVLDNTWKQLVESSKKGIYEYNKSLGDIKASIYLGEDGLKDIAGSKASGTSAQESMFTNFSETIEMRGKEIMGNPMQKAIVGAFDYAIQKSSLSDKGKELLAQFIPDGKTTTSTVRKNIEGFITRIDTLQKEYDIATAHGALFVPDEEDQRAIDAYLQGNVELLSVYKELKPVLNHIYGLLGGEEKGSKQKKDSLADERIRVVDNMYKKYREVVERFGHTEAMDESFKAFKDAFADAYKGIEWIPTDIKSMTSEDFVNKVLGFPSEEKIIEFFGKLANTVKNHEDKIKTELAKGKYVYKLELRTQVEEDKDAIQSIERMFGQYELSLELKDLGVSEDLGKTLFGVDSIGLDDIRDSIQQKMKDALSTGGREEYIKELKGLLQKVEEMEAKALEERMKKYAKYLEQEQTERVKIKLNEVRQLMEIEDTFRIHEKDAREKYELDNEQWKAYEKQRKAGQEINLEFLKGLGIEEERAQAILEQNRLLAEQKQLAYAGVNKTTQEQLDKDTWQSFKKSGYYEMMFSDLEHLGSKAIDSLYEKLNSMQDALKQLPPEVYKEIQSTIDKVETIKLERNPFAALWDARKEVRNLNKNGIDIDIADPFYGVSTGTKSVKGEEEITEEYARQEERLTKLREEEAIVAAVLAVKQGTATIDQQQLTQAKEAQGYLDKQETDLNFILKGKQEEKKLTEQNAKKLKEGVDNYQGMSKAAQASWKKTGQWADAIKNTSDATDALLDSLGVAEDSAARVATQAVSMTADMIINVVQLELQMQAAGAAANFMLGVIGWIALALQAVAKIFTFVFGLHDAKLQKQIEREAAAVEKLENAYKKLEKQLEEAYSIDSIMTLNSQAQTNLQEQIDATERMIALEGEKKDVDQEKIKEYYETLDELKEEQKELEDKQKEELGGFGGAAAYKEAAQSFTEAWLEAFKETGNGLSGLEDTFEEFFDNLITKQLMGRGAETILSGFYTRWNEMLEDGKLDDTEAAELRVLRDEYKRKLNDYYNTTIDAMGVRDDIAGQGELGTLQKGIQGITEDQADILASYLNTIRFIIGENNTYLKTIADNYVSTDVENPMLSQMRIVAEQTTAIRELLDGLLTPHTNGGRGLKVVM